MSQSIQDPVTISEECPSGRDITAIATSSPIATTDSGTPITTCGVDGTELQQWQMLS